jgi:uncharacterized caspase-like protein
MRLAAIGSALAIVLCVGVFGAILLQKASILVPASAPPQATPTESRAPAVADSAAESAVAAPERRQLAQPSATSAEKRFALVIGNAGYQVGALTTPANDAGLIAQTLQAAGFDVAGARDLDQDSLRRAFRDFLEKATNSGPDTVAFIYVSGYGVQLEGENYIVPIDAKIARDSDVAAEAIRMSDYIRPLAALKLKASIVVLDAARANPFAKSGPPLGGGLALVEPEPGMLIAFNATPGTVAPEGQGPYGPYAQALAEMMREGGLPLADVFDRARLRVNDVTKGAEVPWHASKVETSLVFFERAPDAPSPAASTEQAAAVRSRPLGDLGAPEAYVAALDRDTLDGYSEFLTAYPDDPMAARVRAMVAARREAITWRRTRVVDTAPAYWSYLRRYPQGPHAADAHRRLAFLAAAFDPPPEFTALAYDVPPPPPEEIVYIRRPVLVFDDPAFAFAPPPPPPVIFLAPPPPEFVVLAPPPPPVGLFVLPMPVYRPVPVWVRPPAYVAPPPNNLIYNNVHNTVVVNNVTNTVTITNPSGQTQTMSPAAAMAPPAQPAAMSSQAQQAAPAPAAPGTAAQAPAASLAPSLPPSVAQKAATLQPQTPQAGAQPNAPASAATQPPPQRGQPLPGMKGQPLPSATGTSVTPTTPSAAITPATPPAKPGSAKPATAPLQGPAAKPGTPSSPSAAAVPGTPAGSATPATSASRAPAATTPSAAVTPAMSTPAAGERAKRKPPPSQTPAANPSIPTPSAAITPAAPSAAPGGSAKPATPPPQTPAAKPVTPTTPSAAITPGTQSPANKPATPTQVPAGKPATPSSLPTPAKPVIASPSPPPAAVAKPATPHIPAASPVTPPPAKPIAPAAAAAHPAPAPKVAPPQPKGCPPGKAMAVVNGQPVCK